MSEKVKIDANPVIMVECTKAYQEGDAKEGRRLLKEFLQYVDDSGQDHCNCPEACPYHGKCKECVLIHRAGMDHLPYCFRNLLNERLESLSQLTEHSFKERI